MRKYFLFRGWEDPGDHAMREQLDLIRTVLANERTFLAYLRTSLALAVAGVSIFHFLGRSPGANALGVLFVLSAILCFGYGGYRFRKVSREIHGRRMGERPDPAG